MSLILPFKPTKLARVKSSRQQKLEEFGQLNLFAGAPPRMFQLPARLPSFVLATLLHERGDQGARLAYEKAIQEGDHVDDAYVNMGVLAYEADNINEAFTCFRECLKQNPAHFEAHYNLGHLWVAEGLFRPAELHYEIAASLRPEEPEVLFSLGIVYAEQGRISDAYDALSLFRNLVPRKEAETVDDLIAELETAMGEGR
jgi:tetratricopeptide (TPR) repeat protein